MDEECVKDFNQNRMDDTLYENINKRVLSEDDKELQLQNELYFPNKSDETENSEETANLPDNSENLLLEIPVLNESNNDCTNTASSDSDNSIIFYSSDVETNHTCSNINKPKDLLTEISEILLSLSDDERFVECINYSNRNGFVHEKQTDERRTSVDIIFTYNVLNILYNKLKELKGYFELTQAENKKLLKQNNNAEAEHIAYQIQTESLHKIIEDQKCEIDSLKQIIQDEKIRFQKLNQSQNEKLQTDLTFMRKKYENAIQEKETAVMKYVNNESELINVRKEKNNLTKRLKTIEIERDDLLKKSKLVTSEKIAALRNLEQKRNEVAYALKETEKLKEELNCKDIKSKWVEENLQKQLSQCKEQNMELSAKINELEDIVKKYRPNLSSSDENLDTQGQISMVNTLCNENETDIRNFIDDKDQSYPSNQQKIKYDEEKSSLISKIQSLETEKQDYENKIRNLTQVIENQSNQLTYLQEQLTEQELLHLQIKEMEKEISCYRDKITELEEMNEELRQDTDSCREKEAELLMFTEKLTAKNVTLQSEYAILEAKKMSLEADRIPNEERIQKLEAELSLVNEQIQREISLHADEAKRLESRIEEQSKEIESLNSRLEEQQAENQSLKHKYSSTIRELTKEVQQYRKCKQYETKECTSGNESICLESRASSCNSLNEQQLLKSEPDRQTLIEHIVKLQKRNAKNLEKNEFLEEHVSQLLNEVKKKNRVIQYYIIREQSGALSNKMLDQHKAEMSKYGGIMASLYNSKCDDRALTLELSLEINRKLQAVLEDTILKNITLKENVETLGKEIARLTMKNESNEN